MATQWRHKPEQRFDPVGRLALVRAVYLFRFSCRILGGAAAIDRSLRGGGSELDAITPRPCGGAYRFAPGAALIDRALTSARERTGVVVVLRETVRQ